MSIAACVLLALILAACGLIVTGATWAERKWKNIHPPDDWDGMSEVKLKGDGDDDSDSGR